MASTVCNEQLHWHNSCQQLLLFYHLKTDTKYLGRHSTRTLQLTEGLESDLLDRKRDLSSRPIPSSEFITSFQIKRNVKTQNNSRKKVAKLRLKLQTTSEQTR